MRRRLLISMLAVAVAAVLALGIPLGFVLGRLHVDDADHALQHDAQTLATTLVQRQQSGDGIDASYAAQQGRNLVDRYVIIRMVGGFTTRTGTPPGASRLPEGHGQRARSQPPVPGHRRGRRLLTCRATWPGNCC